MASTATEICNLGLDLIAEVEVADISAPTNERERVLQRQYPNVRDALIRAERWVFAREWRQLAQDSGTTLDPDRPYAYTLPADCVLLLRPRGVDWRLNGRQIFTSTQNGLKAQMFVNSKPVPDFDPLFVQVLAAEVCIRLVERRTQSGAKMERLQRHAAMYREMAVIANACEEPARELYADEGSSYLLGHEGYVTREGGFTLP